jgi:FkbM family methyltransferase
MKQSFIASRAVCSLGLQALYNQARRVPLVGGILHTLARRAVPEGTRVSVQVRSGLGTGLVLLVDPRYEAHYAAGLYENALLECLASHLNPRCVLYDVGAHIGFVAMIGARLVGTEGRVFAFEADPQNLSRIRGHAKLNSLRQIEVIGSAVWCEHKTLSFRCASNDSSRNTGAVVGLTVTSNVNQFIRIPAVTLDGFARGHRVPDLIKIDVEGAESEVLRGAEMLFHDTKPVLICEVHSAQASENVSKWLAERGYQWVWLSPEEKYPRHLVAKAG